ncbi:MAG: DUF3127 domain-containing protein [Bacteroidota bacterium]
MDLKGKILQSLPLVTGQGKNGPWRKQEFLIETLDQYPKKVLFSLWSDKIDQNPFSIGQDVVVSFDAESREYNGRYYTELRAWKVSAGGPANSNPAPQNTNTNDDIPVGMSFSSDDNASDDLPF